MIIAIGKLSPNENRRDEETEVKLGLDLEGYKVVMVRVILYSKSISMHGKGIVRVKLFEDKNELKEHSLPTKLLDCVFPSSHPCKG